MQWSEVCDDPTLNDLPYKVELNEWNQIVMTPASNEHGSYQVRMILLLHQHSKSGTIVAECSIETSKGVKVADVAWRSEEFYQKYQQQTPYPKAPVLCIDIRSPSNSSDEINTKIDLYLHAGAQEVWVCDLQGKIAFYDQSGKIPQSILAPSFPNHFTT